MASLPNKGQNYALKMVQVWLAVPMCLFWAIGIRIIRKMGRYKNESVEITAANISILFWQIF